MKSMLSFVILFALSLPLSAQDAKTRDSSGNYCGSGFTEQFVPESILGCKFSEACEKHDRCYGKCDAGGALAGTSYCGQSEFSPAGVESKRKCDSELQIDIDRVNDGRATCRNLGAIYKFAVKVLGQGPFNGKTIPLEAIAKIATNSNSPEEAIAKFRAIHDLARKGAVDVDRMAVAGTTLKLPITRPLQPTQFKQVNVLVIPKGAAARDLEKIKAGGVTQ